MINLYTLPDASVNRTLEGLLSYEVSQVPFLGPGILIFIFLAITLAGSMRSGREHNQSGVIMWLAIGSFISSTCGIILFFYPGIINLYELSISIAMTIVFNAIFFLKNLFE